MSALLLVALPWQGRTSWKSTEFDSYRARSRVIVRAELIE
jgi:hypothetical protein